MIEFKIYENEVNTRAQLESKDQESEKPLKDQTPTIFFPNPVYLACEYFKGPWLPKFHTNELLDYTFGLDYPLQILEIPERRETLARNLAILSQNPQQSMLFEGETYKTIQEYFDNLLGLKKQERPLYKTWELQEKNKIRRISVPQKGLEELLKTIVRDILMKAPVHDCCHGGEQGWSVKRSLSTHLPIGTVLSFDMKNAFRNVHGQYVFDFYYGLIKNKIQNKEEAIDLAGFLTMISTVYYSDEQNHALPQGSPIGIPLFNRILYPIDSLFHQISAKRGMRYSRWVDDLIISSRERSIDRKKILGALRIIREDFPIALNKVFLQQDAPEVYLLGHKILGNLIIKIEEDEAKNRGEPLEPEIFNNFHESDIENWLSEYPEE